MMMLRAVVVHAFLSIALCQQGGKLPCVAKDTSLHGFTEKTFIPMFLGLVSKSLTDTINSHPGFKKVLQDKGACQFECFTTVATESARFQWTLLNKPVPKGFPKDENASKQMLLGAFDTCYPGLAATNQNILTMMMNGVVDGMGDFGSMKAIPFVNPSQTPCPNKSTNDAVDVNVFNTVMGKFGASQDAVLKSPKYKDLKAFLDGAFECQDACMGATANAALKNLWQSGLFAVQKGVMVEAYTGSMKACYPSLPREGVHEFAQDIFDAANKAAKVQRLDDATIPNLLQTATSSGFMVAAFAGSALLVSVLLVVKWKSQQTKRDLTAVSGQNDLETDLDGETENLNFALE